jgi:hypothetical protein
MFPWRAGRKCWRRWQDSRNEHGTENRPYE